MSIVQLSPDESEVMRLISAVWDDRMTPEMCERLDEVLLKTGADRMKLISDFTRLHIGLEQVVSSNSAHTKAELAIAKLKAERARRSRNQISHVKPFTAIAAVLLIALMGYWFWSSPQNKQHLASDNDNAPAMSRPQLPVGRVFRHERARWADGHQFQNGQTLVEGQIVDLVSGTAQISLDFGAELLVEGPCRLTIVSDDLLLLESGKIMVRAAAWAKGFQVKTDDLLATDIGTQFIVSADRRVGSEMHVLEGLVIASSLKQPQSERKVKTNGAIRVSGDGKLESIAFHQGEIPNKLQPITPLRRVSVANTGFGLTEGAKDPRWSITAGHAQHGPFPQAATVCTPGPIHGKNDPDHSQWISVNEGTTNGVPVRSKYTFTTSFQLNGIDPNTVRLTAILKADNGVVGIWLNGKRLPISPWQDWFPGASFYGFNKVEITSGFIPGNNVLSITVNNETGFSEEDGKVDDSDKPNPMSLRVEWAGSGRAR
jgi:hypothetical protein